MRTRVPASNEPTRPVAGSMENAAALAGPSELPSIVTTSPGAMDPDAKLAEFPAKLRAGAAVVWVMVNVYPATISAPDRGPGESFAPADQATIPLPDPLAPEVTVTHEAVLDADHGHPADVATLIVPVPPPAGAVALCGVIA